MKKSLKVLIASSAIMLGVSLLAGCEEKIPVSQIHEHTFSENWEASDSTHWHKATCEHTDVMSGVEDHKFGAWNTDKEPTQEAEGSKSRICTVCQYKQVAAIAKLDHTHVFAEAWSKDAEYHWHDATCHSDVRTAVAEHTFGNWTTKVEPTETTKGLKERECSVCGYVEKAEVDKTLHVHTYASEWSTNETSHWKAATCEHADSFKDFGNHQFGEWVVDSESTETVAGSRHRICSVCGYTVEEDLPLAEHTHTWSNGDNWGKDASAHWRYATCDCEDNENLRKDVADHEWGAWEVDDEPTETATGKKSRGCTVCGYVEEAEIPMLAHTHTYSQQWSKNATEHWHAATCGHDDSRKDVAEHTWGSWVIDNPSNCTTQGTKHRACSICGYVENAPAELNNEAHSFATTWTYNESTHWHAATCGHAVKSGEAAHTMNQAGTNYALPNWSTPLKCNVCGYIAKPAGKDTTEYLPSGYHTYEAYSSTWFKITLRSDSKIRFNFVGGSDTYDILCIIYTPSGGSVTSAWMKDGGSLITGSTRPAGDYYIKVENRSANDYDTLIYNYTYVYTKTLVESRDLTIAEETINYKMYEYKPQYGVNPTNGYVTIENPDEEEVALFSNLTKSTPAEFSSGSFYTTNKNGTTIYIYAPELIYRSEQVPNSPYRIISSTENDVTFGSKDYDAFKNIMSDPYWARLQSLNEANLNFYSWYGYKFVNWTTTSYKKDAATNKITRNNSYIDVMGLADLDFDLDAICQPMTYDSASEEYKYQNPGINNRYVSLKITNTTDANFSMLRGYRNATDYTNGASYGDYVGQWTYILDSNGYRVNTARGHTGRGDKGYGVGNVAWFYNNLISGAQTTDRNIRFEILPGETYYLIDYSVAGLYLRTLSQSTYALELYANNDDVEENDPYLMYDATYGEGVKYQHSSDTAVAMYETVLEKWDVDNLDKDIYGFSKEQYAELGNDPILSFENVVDFEEKEDEYLYAQWIEKENLITTNFHIDSWDSDLSFYVDHLLDPNLELKVGDAVNFVYKDGTVAEQVVTNFLDAGYSLTSVDADNEDYWIYFDNLNTEDERDELLYVTLKTEFSVTIDAGDDLGTDYLGQVAKGDNIDILPFGENWDYADVPTGKYFAGWSLSKTASSLSDIDVLDGGTFTPVRDTLLYATYLDKSGSGLISLGVDIEYVTIGGVDYVKLTIADDTISVNSSTNITLLMVDGTTLSTSFTELRSAASGAVISTATSADGAILIKYFGTVTPEQFASAVQIYIA